jgi:hypothetical protein
MIMSFHWYRASLDITAPAPRSAEGPLGGFVPCPAPLLVSFSAAQQLWVQEIYRIARERTEVQLRSRRRRVPEFSPN